MNCPDEKHTEESKIENPNTELKKSKSPTRWDVILAIIGLIMFIFAGVVIPDAGRVVDNEFVPSKLQPLLIGMFIVGPLFMLTGIISMLIRFFKWIISSLRTKSGTK